MAKFPYKNILEGVKHIWTKSQGPDAEGAAVTANPLTIGYKDAEGKATGVTPTNMLPVGDAAAQAKLADILTKLSADPATQTTLAQILAKIIAEPATEAKQTALNALIGEVQAAPTANTLLARLKNLETKVDAIIADGIKLSGSKMRTVDSIIGTFAVSTSAVAKTIADKNATVHILSGNCWINPLATAVADATAIKLLSGMVLDLRVAATLSLISDATGASVQIIVWED